MGSTGSWRCARCARAASRSCRCGAGPSRCARNSSACARSSRAVARVVAFVPDLLFGSQVIGALRAAKHEAVLVSNLESLEPDAADVLVVDLTAEADVR